MKPHKWLKQLENLFYHLAQLSKNGSWISSCYEIREEVVHGLKRFQILAFNICGRLFVIFVSVGKSLIVSPDLLSAKRKS